ncbi:hypothetical protein LIA77_01838 [Sarocladium implicatum]|nr:hypothetical protein LIA77_01838 [Sarocladium implicatum]
MLLPACAICGHPACRAAYIHSEAQLKQYTNTHGRTPRTATKQLVMLSIPSFYASAVHPRVWVRGWEIRGVPCVGGERRGEERRGGVNDDDPRRSGQQPACQ